MPKTGRRSGSIQFAGRKTNPVQGVFVVDKDAHGRLRAKFVPVTTGITGATDIEVLSGLKQGEEIVTGPYKTLRDLKGGALLKRDTTIPLSPSGIFVTDRRSPKAQACVGSILCGVRCQSGRRLAAQNETRKRIEFRMALNGIGIEELPQSAVISGEDIIVVEDLWRTYDMGSEQQVQALRGVSLRIKHNEYVAIMGPPAPASPR